jgi:hypothetical protein
LGAIGRPCAQILETTDHFCLDTREKRHPLGSQVQRRDAVVSVHSRPNQQSALCERLYRSTDCGLADGEPIRHA